MDIILKGVSTADLQYLRGALECRKFKVRTAIDKVRSDTKLDSEVDSKEYYESVLVDLDDELNCLNGLLDMF